MSQPSELHGRVALRDRYVLARFDTGGVVVDLSTGNYFRVNRSAAFICDALLNNGSPEEHVASGLNISRLEARKVIAAVMADLSAPPIRTSPPGAYHFLPAPGGYVLRQGNRVLLEVRSSDQIIRFVDGRRLTDCSLLEFYVRALAPKLLFQREVTVLHASACLTRADRIIAFAGLSGAGKTTTAQAFAGAGMRLISEDLVVFLPRSDKPRAVVGAERFIHEWARRIAERLLENPTGVPSDDLAEVVEGPTVSVDHILLLDRSRRVADRFSSRPLDEPDALIALLMHDFLGSSEVDTWRRYLVTASELVKTVDTREASAPAGVHLLPAAVVSYISKQAS